MKVFGLNLGGYPLTTPYPDNNGVIFRLLGGDFVHPRGQDGNWFREPYFTELFHWHCPWAILPFFSFKLGRFGMYVGFKTYGFDSDAYKLWPATIERGLVGEVYDGSQAMQLSIRFSTAR